MRRLGLDVLATVPRLGRGHTSPADEVIGKPMSSFAEAYRVTRRSLASASSGRPMVIAITSTLPNEGKTTSALSLARIMAMAGEKTLLIDTDLRRAGLRDVTGIGPERGLVELLHGDVTLAEAVIADQVEGLDLLPVAHANYSPEDVFSGEAMAELLAQVRGSYDRIVLDCAPLLGSPTHAPWRCCPTRCCWSSSGTPRRATRSRPG
ncbi:CpsD/CapB family tyrosine-protein kinase [Sphingomonas sp. I4]